ncbi:DUF461 domain-containing protein [Streptomyces sp. NPDC049954]|uniref:DUF461 domain-containing protein n=1 Tax=Streptomyces sp. NPDC049954 TaxID=3155779 RepID=UPI003433471E
MSSSLRRGALAASALAFSIATLAACGAGNNAQTLEVKPDNAAATVGQVKIQNATVVTQPKRDATGPAVVTGTVFNNGPKDQTLESVTVNGERAELKSGKGGSTVTVPAGGSVLLGGKGNASAVLPSGRESVRDGATQLVNFTLSETGNVRIPAYVVPATSYFKGWGPTEAPSPAASAADSASPNGSASPSSSASGEPGTDTGQPSESAGTPSDTASANVG